MASGTYGSPYFGSVEAGPWNGDAGMKDEVVSGRKKGANSPILVHPLQKLRGHKPKRPSVSSYSRLCDEHCSQGRINCTHLRKGYSLPHSRPSTADLCTSRSVH